MKNNTTVIVRGLLYALLTLFLAGTIINCGGGSSSTKVVQAQAPKALIQDFIAKHDTMVDNSLVKFYVNDEQPIVAAAVEKSIEEKKASGELEKLQNATFDFSNLKIVVAGEKEEYVNDHATKLMKVDVSGSYVMKHDDGPKTIPANETIILEMVNNDWKVTEKINPWHKYHYNNKG